MKIIQVFYALLWIMGMPWVGSACQFLTQAGTVLSGFEPPRPNLWLVQGDTLKAIENSQIVETEHGKLQVVLKPYPPRQANYIDLYLENEGGQPIEDAQVVIKYEMLDMAHGYEPLPTIPQGGGHYSARLELPMKGMWQIEIAVSRSGTSQPITYWLRLRNDFGAGGLGGHTGH